MIALAGRLFPIAASAFTAAWIVLCVPEPSCATVKCG